MDEFRKPTTNVGGSVGVIIPKYIRKKLGIEKGSTVRILVEALNAGQGIESPNLQNKFIHSIADEASA